MTNKPESAAVEAVAWQARIYAGDEWQAVSKEAYDIITGWDKRALYPQSALYALRARISELEAIING